jgi:hypothetical protein
MIVLPVSMQQMKDSNETFFIELYIINLPSGNIYLAATDEDIMFNGKKYLAVPFQRQDITRSMDNITDSCTITLGDVGWGLLAYVTNGWDFRGGICTIFRIQYPDSLSDPSIVEWVFTGRIDEPSFSDNTFSCKLVQVFPEVQCPNRSSQLACNSEFGDDECKVSLGAASVKITGTQSNGSVIVLAKSFPDKYWQNGVISCGGEARNISVSSGDKITVNVNFLQNPIVGKTAELRRGCNKTVDDCKRFNNLKNYGGFPAIPHASVYR